jgi:hypothetical protein
MRVTAEPVLGLKDGDVMGAGEEVGSGKAGDSRPDDGDRRPPCARSCAMLLGGGAGGGRRAIGAGVHIVSLRLKFV